MTEIPEHLLKRSQARRAAATDSGDGESASSDKTPATRQTAQAPTPDGPTSVTRAPSPAEPAEPEPTPPPPVVVAASGRKRIPSWAMVGLALLPVWGFMYFKAVTPQPVEASGPIAVGTEAYSNCASCHGGQGQGSAAGRKFTEGEVLKTFPHIEDQIRYVYYGTDNYNAAGIKTPGDPKREGGPHATGAFGVMPGWGGNLTDAQILGVVCHERYDLGGADPTSEQYENEFELWCSEESPVFSLLEGGSSLQTIQNDLGSEYQIKPIGEQPAEGSSAS